MKKVIIISIILSVIFSLILFFNYKKESKERSYEKLYFIQVGSYSSYNNALNLNKINGYLIIKENDDLYHVYSSIVKNKNNLEKLKVFYEKNRNNIYVREKYVSCDNFIKDLNGYEIILENASEDDVISKINNNILKLYEENKCEDVRNG